MTTPGTEPDGGISEEDLVEDGLSGMDMDNLNFDEDLEPEEDFTEEEEKPAPRRKGARQAAPASQATAVVAPNNAKRNTLILSAVTVGLILLAAAWIFLTPTPKQQRAVRNADNLLPAVNQMHGQQNGQQGQTNSGVLINTRQQRQSQPNGQQPAGLAGVNQGVRYPSAASTPSQAPQTPSSGTYSSASQTPAYNQGQQNQAYPYGQHQLNTPGVPSDNGNAPLVQQTQGEMPQQTWTPPSNNGSQNGTQDRRGMTAPAPPAGLPPEHQAPIVSEQMGQLLEQINQLAKHQENLVAELRKSNKTEPADDQKVARLTAALETVRKEKEAVESKVTELLAKIAELEAEKKDLIGKNTFLRAEERKWRHMVQDLEEKLAAAPVRTAQLNSFKAKWELRGLDPNKAVFISRTGDIQEVRVGDQIGGLTISGISFAKRQVLTNAGVILYQ